MGTMIVALFSGALFGVGLAVSWTANPEKAIGFLDVAGDWTRRWRSWRGRAPGRPPRLPPDAAVVALVPVLATRMAVYGWTS